MTYAAQRRAAVDRAYRKRYELLRLRGVATSPVAAEPIAAHVRALYEIGWSSVAIGHLTGEAVTYGCATLLMRGETTAVHRSTAAAIMDIPLTLRVPPTVPDECMVPSLGATRRIHALMRLGWNHEVMRERFGFDTTALARNRQTQMAAWKWRAVAAMYEELSMTIGPSEKTATFARNRGHHAPLAWRDIDNPDENPTLGKHQRTPDGVVDRVVVASLLVGARIPSTRAEKVEALRMWRAMGRSQRSLCVIHGWNDGRYTEAAS